ncbi:non-ribosomal peptide synthase/polyketide synthase [Nostoc sp. WHI]|uniref:non-ribosomal peptide synthase/polyketide synthase n=1 Tax=Nostoc sp. WHI TaxID=2650611 RepID=UPI0018C8360E|nr:non-ribosomal peptide synthase/polyketide synthase [Nostoc sp. WHI]MBG1265934.1 amino acid adenylation domain-containing protein [Nostoc sp. WHI]
MKSDIKNTNRQNIEEIYPLSPMQQGMLFHSLYDPESGVYFAQVSCTLTGNLDVQTFEQAWEKIVAKHSIFRTAFVWESLSQPVQVVYRQVQVTVETYNWQELSVQEQQQQLEIFLECDRQKGLQLSQAPLMRLHLIQLNRNTYQFVWSSHHLLLDGWSLPLVFQDLLNFYQAISQGETFRYQPTVTYRNYIAWLQKQDQKQAEKFWKQKLQGFTAPTHLTVEKPLSDKYGISYGEQKIQFTASLTTALQSFVRQNRLTLNNLVQATWALLLSRYSQETDVVFGMTVSGREPSIVGIESMVGLFINTMPIRVQVAADTQVLALLKDLQVQQVESEQYSYSSLAEIQGWSEIPRGTPLFDSIVVFENFHVDAARKSHNDSFTIENIHLSQHTNYPLTVVAYPGQQLQIRMSYNTSQFDDAAIARMLGHFQTLIEGIIANPQQRVSQLPMLTAGEQQQLLVEWNNTQAEYPQNQCIHQLFEEQVQRTPDTVAVTFGNQQLTYQQLNTQANQLAHYLKSLGVGVDVLVGICVERSLEMIVGILGILKAGGAYVPLDPEYPQERLSFMLEDAQLPVLLTQQHLVESVSQHQARVICIDTDWEKIAQECKTNLENTVTPNNLAYVIYTSGSTGKPKGVLVNHANVVRLFAATDFWYHFNSQDVWTLFHSYAFDFSVWEIWGALFYGGRLVVVPYLVTRSPESFYELLCQEKVTVLNQTPSAFRQLIQAEQSIGTANDSSLRLVIFGGEALELQSLQPWFDRHGDSSPQLVNMYGITETTVHVTYRPLSKADLHDTASVIGCLIPDLQVYLLDQNLQPVPIGVRGEMYVGGAGVTRGYLNRPELTQQRFISNPFAEVGGSRLYRTGDLARYLPNGELEYLGRIDNQVKIRGFRIELGEIEGLLAQHPAVWENAVVVREDERGDKRLVAYIVPKPEQSTTVQELRQFLGNQLPSYMIPNAFMLLESLPLTSNGKIDRRALPKPDLDSTQLEKFVAPRSPIEEMLAQIWAQVLKIEQVGIHDNFFELGGHSLLATQLVSRIRNLFKVELPLRELFTNATVAQLGRSLQQLQQQDIALTSVPILKRTENAELPLSFAQQRLWFLDQLEPNSPFYNTHIALRLVGTLKVAALEQSLQEIIHRHEALRTNFITVDGQATQIIQTQTNWKICVVDLQHLPASEKEIATQQLAQQQIIQPFDLATQALVRATLVVLSETEQVLLVCMHHIVSDGWSMGVFVQELTALYDAYSQGQSSTLAPLSIQYADFAIWQRQWLQGEVLQSQLSYWLQQLANAPALLSLPTDRPRPPVQTFVGARQQFPLSLELTLRLTQLSQQQGVTLFMTLLAAYDTLLYRYTGVADILVGTPIANRNHSETEGLIGFFVNTLVMRTDLSENPSFSSLLTRVREMALGAYAHQDLPFEMLVEALQPERNLSHTPLFQVMFALENSPISQLELTGLTVNQLKVKSPTAKFDLTLSMENTATGLVGVWEYNTDLFDTGTIERMALHLATLLEGIVANPQQCISQLPLLTKTEQQQLLIEWNDTQVDYPQDKCIHQLFEEQVQRTPHAVAVVRENQQLTYYELNCRANQLAHYLKSLGVGADVLVGLCVERSPLMIVGLLGILKAGGAYVPLDPEYPQDRLSLMVEDAQLSVLLTQQHLVEKLPEHQAQLVCLDTNWQSISQSSDTNLVNSTSRENLAYVIYTSGSTGKPKGVMIRHQSLVNFTLMAIVEYKLSNCDSEAPPQSTDRILQFSSISFDTAAEEIYPCLSCGAMLVLRTDKMLNSVEMFVQKCRDWNLTVLNLPTAYWHQLAFELASTNLLLPDAIRLLIIGGEQALEQRLRMWQCHIGNYPQLINTYGPTEATVEATQCKLLDSATTEIDKQKIAIGRPIHNTQIYILDQYLQPVPIGVAGELHIGGAGLARGYLNRPELTQEKFIPNPFEKAEGSRLYKTGDLARYLPDGNIEYLGRIDNQVKIRGFRIELGEIETVLSQYPHVQACCVIAREDIPGEKRLVAYIVPRKEVTPITSELRQFLANKVPGYMVPQAFVMLEFLPLTPNDKVDRHALPAPDLQSDADKYIAPHTPTEEMLVQIWAQVLKVEQVGIHDNFFELGGHSLLATQLVSRIRKIFQVELPLRELFATATVGELAKSIEQLQKQELKLVAPLILPRAENVEIPLSFAQQRLWFLDQFDPNSALYNIPFALRVVGTLHQVALQQSLQQIIQRHEALCTNFIAIDGEARQIIREQEDISWTVSIVDLQHLPGNEQEIAVQELTQQQALQPFDLANQALVRVTLLVLSETEHILLMCMHHIVSDGWSIGVFVQELTALYNAYAQGQPTTLARLPIQYADFAIWQRQWLQGDVLQSQLDYWQKQLKDAPTLLPLPTDRPRGAVQTFAGAHQEFALSVELTQKLTKLSQQKGCTLFMTLLAAFDTLLYRYTGVADILVGTPIANRDRSEIEGLIGFFVNTLVLRTDLSGNPSFNELLGRVREMAMDAYAYQDLPFEMLVEALQPERDLSHAPLFQVDFLLQNDPLSTVELTGLTVSSLPIETAMAKFDLTLAMQNTPTGLVGVWEYNTDLFDHSTIERMRSHFVTLLEAVVANPQERIDQLPLLTAVEQQQILFEWNDTQGDYPEDKCLHQLFEQQAELTPDAVAVVFDNEQLTYQELNTQANQLAHYLQSLGVEQEVLVGIYLERSLSIIVTLLAVLKAGGGYVPLDPDYPQQRLADISQDSQVAILITQQKLLDSLPVQGVKVIVLDAESETLNSQSQENLVSGAKPENLACLLYTSGSTGKPKGVTLTHAALVNHSSAISEVFGLTSSDRVLQFASLGFDVAVEEIFPTWYKGGTVVVRPVQMFSDFANLAKFIEQQKLTVLNITPAYWHEWTVAVAQSYATVPQCLRLVAVGGDAVLPETVTMWRELVRDRITCLNVYGPTEASVTAVVHDLLHPESGKTNTVLIGRPIANTQIYILDRNLQPVPVGIRGELHIGGVRLARGYFNRPELTQEKFLPNQFKDPKCDRIYKTGDLARYLPNGNIECFGRIDNQVKIRGFRIELGEIEAVLNQHPDVQTSCVILREDTPGDKRLVAYIVPYAQEIPAISELRQFISNRLPLYMVPSTFVALESLPLTAHRKVDRRALPALNLQSEQIDNYVAPRTPTEETLAEIWAQVLKLEQVGIHDNFFELGGHSLLATQLVSRIRNIFKIELPLRSIFAAATVAALADLIGQLQPQNLELTSPSILPRAKDAELSLSFAQQRLWFLEQLQPNSALYNIPEALRLVGTLNQAALEQSLQEIIQRHEALRTNFIAVDGQARQIIQTHTDWQVSVVDLQHLPVNQQEITVQQLAQEQALQPFDLATQPLIRATLLVLNEAEHILLVCMHHIISDDWSMGVFVQELTALYNAYAQGQPTTLPLLPIQYADFALWQRQWLQGDVLQSQLDYWQEQLKDAPALLALPTDRLRGAVQTFAGAHQKFELSPQLTERLTQLSHQQGATLFMTLLAAYDTLLYRYTGVADILVGTPIANRNRSEIEGLIGFFVNTLVMRTDLSANPSFCDLLGRVREVALGAYAHQDLPFEMLVEALQPERNLSHTPLFQMAFMLQNAPMSEVEMTGLTITHLSTESVNAKFDLTLAMGSTDEGLVGVWEYNTDLFDASTIARMAGHFVTLLEAIVANPQERISQLPLLTTVEQQQLLIDWNDTQVDYPADKCIHQLFEEQVERTPDAVAVVYENEQLTYHELNCRANQLARYLKSLGVGADELVGICLERTPLMMVGLVGILKAGGAYVPLNHEDPKERLEFMLADTQVKVLLTQDKLVESLPQHQARVVCLDTDWQIIYQENQDNLNSTVSAENLAYVIYTSGSTGRPKGVVVTHQAVNRLVLNTNYIQLTPDDCIAQAANIAFDAATFEIWGALLHGARLVIITKSVLLSPQEFAVNLRSHKVSVLFLTTALVNQLANLLPQAFASIRYLLFGGEAVDPRWVQEVLDKGAPQHLLHVYGPTENTTFSTWYLIEELVDTATTIPIGQAISNTKTYILDQNLQPVPVGVPGELYLGGVGLARGYLNRPELTNEKFIPNPFAKAGESRLYKTGDLARYLPDSNIEYLGRIDNQVKIRGFRIELGEIETVLNQHEDIQTSCVITREDILGQKQLVAYVVPQKQVTPTSDELRQFLKAKLPDYMVPNAFVILEALPLTPNGKVDRRALPAPDLDTEIADKFVAPRNSIEEKIALIWSQVLRLERVGIDDNFFEVGGHSLLATQVISRLQEAFGTSLLLRYLFESPTIAQLSEVISSQLETGSNLTVTPIVPVSRNADIPLSWAQERLWFVNQLEGESGAYTIDLALRLVGQLNVKALEQAFAAIVQRHEPLRTRFGIKDNKPVQVIDPYTTFTLPVVDLQNLPDPIKRVEQLVAEEACKPFDLANGSVLRVKLWQVAQDEYVLAFAIHHIAADGWSLGVLISELSAYYRAIATGNPITLPELPIQYADFAVWQRQWLINEVLERQLSYWKQQLTGAPPLLELPTDRLRPAIQTFRGGTERLQLDANLTQQLKKLSQESGSTLFMTLLAGFVALMSRYSGQTDLVVGSPIANRNRTEIEGLIGFFVNTLALRFDLSQEPTFEALLAQVRRVTQEAYDHQDLPFEMLVEELQVERNLDRNPLVQVVFALQNAPFAPLELPGLTVEGMASGLDSVRLDLEVYLWDAPEGLGGFCSYNRDLFDAATIARMMQHFQILLKAMSDDKPLSVYAANPQQPVALLPLLSEPERHQLLVEWNSTQVGYPQDKCIHQLFEEQVARTPDAVAVVFENQQLTYHQLNCRANQLAHYLRSLGVEADVLVGLCVERTPLMVIGLLAILKAGGAYVPLDPEYPSDRLSFMLEDTQVRVLLTQERLLDKLPQHQAKLVFLNEVCSQIDSNNQDNLTIEVTASHLANVIYTSGSTGKPKGVMVEHRGLYNLALTQIQAFGVQSNNRVLQFASFSFDACISEILMSLGSGATLYLATKDSIMPGTPLIERLRNDGITHVTLPPSALAVVPTQELPALQAIIVAGEACSPELVKLWSVGRNFFNAYGPTEASVCATIAKCNPEDEKVTIGRPIANTQIYILDSHLQLVPVGVPGEIHIGGVGLARGYINRVELTQEKFISNPFSDEPHSRLYKTGDLARYLPDGNIEYLGRIDNQVKIRGFRIELGEIEDVLTQHPLIQEGVVVAKIDRTGDKQLVAYLVPALKNKVLPQQLAQWQSEYVSDWQMLYEQAYGQPQTTADDLTFNISGWNSSYTKQAIPDWEMREWVENTVSRILSLSPQRVLEIGCGTGLLLSRVAPKSKEYWGIDYSSAALQHVDQMYKTLSGLDNVHLLQRTADNFDGIPQGEFDTIVINSVVQYFPSVDYLLQVIEGAIATIAQQGKIFMGDVRSLPLLEAFHAAVQLSQASEDKTTEQWQQQVNSSVAAEEELLIDPGFFIALQTRFPQITWVEIQPKRGNAQNELTQFRYDVTLHINTDVQTPVLSDRVASPLGEAEVTVVPWLNWQLDGLSLKQIENQLLTRQPEILGIRGVPNKRVQPALQIWQWWENPPAVETVGQLQQLLAQHSPVGINPEQFYQLGQELGYTVQLSWWESSQDGSYDVVFCRNQAYKAAFWDSSSITAKPWTEYTNNPLYSKLVQKLVPQVRSLIQQKLPNYMVPQAFVLLKAMPLTPNGKVDRRALPAPDTATRNLATGFVSPRTPLEAQLVQIWSEVLGTERIGVKDNFFELGGHSLLATQVVSRINSALGFGLSVQKMFEFPTVAGLASYMEVMDWAAEGLAVTEVSGQIVEF